MASATNKPFLSTTSPSPQWEQKDVSSNTKAILEENPDYLVRAQTIDKQIKHRVRVLRVIQRTGSSIASMIVLGVMGNTYFQFSAHKTANINGSIIQVYPKMPILWPTYMMLATSTVSLVFNFAILSAYCISLCRRNIEGGVKRANTIANYQSKVGYLFSAVSFVVWLSTSTTFKMLQGASDSNPPPRDLFGYSCSTFTDTLTAEYQKAVPDFNLQCETQQASFAIGVFNAFLELFGLFINIMAVRRLVNKKKLERISRKTSDGKL